MKGHLSTQLSSTRNVSVYLNKTKTAKKCLIYGNMEELSQRRCTAPAQMGYHTVGSP